jgi:EAL domain-containing protein (putative c-di-GMP-specific phosphodiesterase class I)
MLKFSYVKLDSSLTKAIEDEHITQVVINSIIKLLVAFNAKICVSDVDTPREYKYLTDLAIDYCQGIFISSSEKVLLKPLSKELQHKFL